MSCASMIWRADRCRYESAESHCRISSNQKSAKRFVSAVPKHAHDSGARRRWILSERQNRPQRTRAMNPNAAATWAGVVAEAEADMELYLR